MKKFCAVACTVGFGLFWVFGGLSALSLALGHPVQAAFLAFAAIGLGAGIAARLKIVQLTRGVPVGARVRQDDSALA